MTGPRIYELTEDQWKSQLRLMRLGRSLAHALYDGMPGGQPDSDADILRGVADWLDKADDARDLFLAEHGHKEDKADRSVQADLRRIADELGR